MLCTAHIYTFSRAQLRALAPKANKFEKVKNAKAGPRMWTEVGELGALLREGNTKWEDLDLDDVDIRLKWAGLFHRRKRTPGRFMMRLKVQAGGGGSGLHTVARSCVYWMMCTPTYATTLMPPGTQWRAHR